MFAGVTSPIPPIEYYDLGDSLEFRTQIIALHKGIFS
jgi:hypothetical protein